MFLPYKTNQEQEQVPLFSNLCPKIAQNPIFGILKPSNKDKRPHSEVLDENEKNYLKLPAFGRIISVRELLIEHAIENIGEASFPGAVVRRPLGELSVEFLSGFLVWPRDDANPHA